MTRHYIGTDVSGTGDLGNNADGIYVNNTANNTIGGTTAGARNVIAGNNYGILISGPSATNNLVLGNYIGTDASGAIGLGTQTDGLRIRNAPNNTVGGTTLGARNIFAGGTSGVIITGAGATGNQVLGNYIGTDVTGTLAIGSTRGVAIETAASNNVIGGSTPGSGNVISGNDCRGIDISSESNNNLVQGNFIGTDATGTVTLGNNWAEPPDDCAGAGIKIQTSSNNLIGGTTLGARNIISGNGLYGVKILASPGGANSASGNRIEGNFIGTDVTGTSALGNDTGVYFWGAVHDNIIGGPAAGAGNLISGNTNLGVDIQDLYPDGGYAIHNTISKNSITGNGSITKKGIYLGNCANESIQAPVITAVTATQVSGTSTAPGSVIEIFQDPGDQGKVYIGSTPVVAGGDFTFTGTPPPGGTGGNLTATVTDSVGNTSEFSLPVQNNLLAATASVWRTETVDSAGDAIYFISIDLDSSGYPHISCMDTADWDLMHAYHNGSGWVSDFVDRTFWVGDTSLKMDSSDRIHLSYFGRSSGGLNYAYSDDGKFWDTETIDSERLTGFGTSIALNLSDYPHVSYFYDNAKKLKYTYFDETGWHTEIVDTSVYNTASSIDLDSLGKPHICYYDYYSQEIRYAHKEGESWKSERVTSAAHYAHPSMALDLAGKPHIEYYDPLSRTLNHASLNETWSIETVDDHGGPGFRPSIAVDSLGNLHISYIGDGSLKYAYRNGSGWHIETVDSSGLCGYHTSLTLDASDNPHIGYLDLTNKSLKYASRYGIAISDTETIDLPGEDIQISISEGSFSVSPAIVEPGAGIPDGFITPYGAISFTITGLTTYPVATVTVILTLPAEPPAGTTLFKCVGDVCSPIMGVTISGNQVVFDVTDGGTLDEDLTVNGEIVEPSVVAIPDNPEVAVDIKPGSCPNPVNVNSRGVLPVAILGTNDLDVTTIDPESIRLAGVSPLRWALEDVATPYEPFIGKQNANDCTDAGPDGVTDLTLKFNTQELVQSLEVLLGRELEDGEAVVVRLSGNLRQAHGSAAFLGEDVVIVLKKK